ncbi:MAG: phosphoglycerate dehydrogenase, partial [Nitrospinota bacterium]
MDLAPVRARLKGLARVLPLPLPFRPLTPEEEADWGRRLAPASGLLVRPGYITRNLLGRMPRLKVVAVHGAGVDQVDVEACTERGVWVTNAPGANANAVAELTLGLMLSLLRGIPGAAARVR